MVQALLNVLTCRGTSRLAAEGLDEARGLAALGARLHLLYCRQCRRYLRQLRLIAAAARAWAGGLVGDDERKSAEGRMIERLTRPQ